LNWKNSETREEKSTKGPGLKQGVGFVGGGKNGGTHKETTQNREGKKAGEEGRAEGDSLVEVGGSLFKGGSKKKGPEWWGDDQTCKKKGIEAALTRSQWWGGGVSRFDKGKTGKQNDFAVGAEKKKSIGWLNQRWDWGRPLERVGGEGVVLKTTEKKLNQGPTVGFQSKAGSGSEGSPETAASIGLPKKQATVERETDVRCTTRKDGDDKAGNFSMTFPGLD